jgi:hypothetical protein
MQQGWRIRPLVIRPPSVSQKAVGRNADLNKGV